MNIDNLKLRTKVVIPLMVMAAVVVAMVAFGATRLIGVSATASDIIEKRDLAAVELTRAAAAMSGVPHAIFAVLLYDQDDAARKAAKRDFESLAPQADMLLNLAASHLPDKAAEIGKFKEQFDKIAAEAKEPMQVSLDTPGLIHGMGIQPDRPHPDGTRGEPRHRSRHACACADRRHEQASTRSCSPPTPAPARV